jgi:esterase/lipase
MRMTTNELIKEILDLTDKAKLAEMYKESTNQLEKKCFELQNEIDSLKKEMSLLSQKMIKLQMDLCLMESDKDNEVTQETLEILMDQYHNKENSQNENDNNGSV